MATNQLQFHIEQSMLEDYWVVNGKATYAMHYSAETKATALIDLQKRQVVDGFRDAGYFIPGTSLFYLQEYNPTFKDAETGEAYVCPLNGRFTAIGGGIAQIRRSQLLLERPDAAGWVGTKLNLPVNAIASELLVCGHINTPTVLDVNQGKLWSWKGNAWLETRKNFINDEVRCDAHALIAINSMLPNTTICRQWDYTALELPIAKECTFPKFSGQEMRTALLSSTRVVQQISDNGESRLRFCTLDASGLSTESFTPTKAFLVGSKNHLYQLDAQGLKSLSRTQVIMPDFEF